MAGVLEEDSDDVLRRIVGRVAYEPGMGLVAPLRLGGARLAHRLEFLEPGVVGRSAGGVRDVVEALADFLDRLLEDSSNRAGWLCTCRRRARLLPADADE